MKYLFVQDTYYHFRRRIPKTSKNFTFKCKTKNAKIATRISILFLTKAEPLFQILKSESAPEIMENFQKIMDLLLEYRDQALIEYGDIEKERHVQFTCVSKKGKKRDGGHPKCIKKWLKTLQDAVYSSDPNNNYKLFFNDIFKRTRIDASLYDTLSAQEQEIIQFETVKKEAHILSEDYYRAKQRFDPNHKDHRVPLQSQSIQAKSSKYYEKTAREIADDFILIKQMHTSEIHKYKGPIDIFLSVINKKYLIDFTSQDMQDFIFVMQNLPPQKCKEDKELFAKHQSSLMELAQHIKTNNMKSVSLKYALEKTNHVISMLDFAVSEDYLDKNRLSNKHYYPSGKKKADIIDNEEKDRVPFSNEELNKLFNESTWFTKKFHTYLLHEQDRIYMPLIGLLQGLRLNEAAQLYICQIIEENGVSCFKVDIQFPEQKLKNKRAKRIVPVHPKLIELGFLDYVRSMQNRGEKRVFPQLFFTKGKGYGQSFSKKFNNKNFKKQWIKPENLDNEELLTDFHSLRHTFSTRLSGRSEDSQLDFMMGHEGKSENQKRYTTPDARVLLEALKKLDIEGIDFPKIPLP